MKYYNASLYNRIDDLDKKMVIEVGKDGTIVDITQNQEYEPEPGDVDCKGYVLYPSFMDSAVTLPGKEIFKLFGVDISEKFTVEDYLYEISLTSKEIGIRGYGFNTLTLGEDGAHRVKKLLDTLCPTKPAYIYADDMTNVIVNDYILEEVKKYVPVSKDMHATGMLDMRQIMTLKINTTIFDFTVDEAKLALKSFQVIMLEQGITSIRVLDVMGGRNMLTALKMLNDEREWKITTVLTVPMYPFDTTTEMLDRYLEYKRVESDRVYVTGVSISLDGSIDSMQAALTEPYAVDPQWRGDIIWNADKLAECTSMFLADGVDVNFNAYGDRAVQYAVAMVAKNDSPRNITITHAYLVSDLEIQDCRNVNITFCIEPNAVPYCGSFYEGDKVMLGERIYAEYPVGRLMYAGLNVISGSNTPMQRDISPINGVYKASHRTSDDDATPYHLLQTYGPNAYQTFGLWSEVGSIEIGKKATFCILNRDIIHMRESMLCDCKAVGTVECGELVYASGELVGLN